MAIFAWTYRIFNLGVDCVAKMTYSWYNRRNKIPLPALIDSP